MQGNARSALAGIAVLLMSSCAAMDEPAAALEGTAWVLAAIPGRELVNGSPATLQFQTGRAGGSDGCNRYSVGYRSDGAKLQFDGSPTATLMACPPGVQQQAQWFTDTLQGTRAWRIAAERLLLLDAQGRELATLVAQRQILAGTRWSATGINNGQGGVASLLAGTRVTLEFDAQGRLSGSAGCNNYTGGYQQSGSSLTIAAPAATRRFCTATGVMDQEAAFLRALVAAATARIEGGRLELRDAGGALQVSAGAE